MGEEKTVGDSTEMVRYVFFPNFQGRFLKLLKLGGFLLGDFGQFVGVR